MTSALSSIRPRRDAPSAISSTLLCWVLLMSCFECVLSTPLPGELVARLNQAALQVVKIHTGTYPSSRPVPHFFSADQLMHSSYRTKSTVSDREELQVTKLLLSTVRTDVHGAVRWTHLHHNHTNHVMAVTRNSVHLWRFVNPNADLRTQDALFRFNSGSEDIVDAITFVRNEKNFQTMNLVLVIRTEQTAKLVVYEVDSAGQVMLFSLPLGEIPIKVRWLQSQQQGALVVLFPSAFTDIGFTDVRQGGSVLGHVVKVYMPMAVDLETTTIAGYGYITVSNSTSVLVYRSDELAGNFKPFDSLHGQDLTDVALFRVGFESLLAVAGMRAQFLYVWRGGGFYLRQVFSVPRGFQWHPISLGSCRDDVLLALATTDATYPIKLFAWSSRMRQFREIDRGTVPLGGFLALKDSISSFSVKDNAWMFFTDSIKGGSKSVMVSTKVVLLPNPVQEKGSQLVLRMRALKDQLDQQQLRLSQASNVLRHAISTRSPANVVNVKQVIRSILVNGPVSMGFAKFPQGLSMEGSPVSITELQSRLPDLQKGISELGFKLRRLTSALRDAAYKSKPATITGPKTIKGHIMTQQLKSAESTAGSIYGTPTANLFRDLYWLHKPTPVTGKIILTRPARVRNVLQSPSINGVNLGEAVTTDRHHTIHGQTTFLKPLIITRDSFLEGTLNGMKLSSLVTLSGNHYISAPKALAFTRVLKALSSHKVDGVDLVRAASTSLSSVGDQVVSGHLSFARDFHAISLYTPALNGISVADIGSRFVRTNRPATITGFKNFVGGFETQKHLSIGGRLNRLAIPQDLLFKDADQLVAGQKSFKRLITAVTTVEGRVNGISLPRDVYRLTNPGHFDVPLAFASGLRVSKDIVVSGTVDNVDISDFASYAYKQPDRVIQNNVVFKSPVVVRKSVTASAMVNSVLLDSIYNDAIFPTGQSELLITGTKTFHNGANVSLMTVKGSVNGYNLIQDLLATEDHQMIEGTKTLAGPVLFEQDLDSTSGIVDGVHVLSLLAERITLDSEQNITAEPLFLDTVRVKDLYTLGRIQGLVVPRDFALKSIPQKIYGTKHLAHGVSAALIDSRIRANVKGHVGGVDIVDLYRRRVTLSSNQMVSGDFFMGNVSSPMFNAILLNGRPVQEFLGNVMSKSRPQVVEAPKTFTGILKASAPVTTTMGVNGAFLKAIDANSVGLRGPSVITAPVAMRDTFVILGKTSIHGTLDGRDLRSFEADVVPKRGWVSIGGNCVFYAGLAVSGNIAADTVNDLMLSYDVLLKSSDQSIKGHYYFKKGVEVLGDLPHMGHVNGIDLSVLDMLVAKVDRENVIQSNLDIESVADIATDLSVDGLVNGHKLRYLRDQAICHAKHHDIPGTKVIRGPVDLLHSLDVRHYDNQSLSALFDDIVFIDGGHFTTAPKVLTDVLLEGSLNTRHAHFQSHVNGIPVGNILKDAVLLNGKCNLSGVKIFKDHVTIRKNLTVLGLVNGLRIPDDILQLCHTNACPLQRLHDPVFDDVQVPGHLPVLGAVNGHSLPQALGDTLLLNSNQTVPGAKDVEFVVFTRNVLPGLVNGIPFRKEVVTLGTPQTVRTALALSSAISPNVNAQGLVNGVDINQLVRDIVYLDVPQTFSGTVQLNKVVARENIKLVGTLNNVHLPELHKDLSIFELAANQLSTAMGQRMNRHEEALNHLSCFLTDSYSLLDHFDIHQYLDVEATLVDVALGVGRLRLVDAHEGHPVATAFHFTWGQDLKWQLQSVATSDEGRRVYFRLEGKVHWLEEPLVDSRARRGILTDGVRVVYSFGNVLSISGVAKDFSTALVASLTKNGVLDTFSYTLHQYEPVFLATIDLGPEAENVKLLANKGTVYAAVSLYEPGACLAGNVRTEIFLLEGKDRWNLVQTIRGGSVLGWFSKGGLLYALLTDVDVHSRCNEASLLKVYRTCAEEASPVLKLFQVIPFASVTSLEVVHFGARLDVYLVAGNLTSVQLYVLEGEAGFRHLTSISVKNLKDLKLVVLEGELYLIVAQGHSTGKTLVYKGVTQGAKETFKRYPLV